MIYLSLYCFIWHPCLSQKLLNTEEKQPNVKRKSKKKKKEREKAIIMDSFRYDTDLVSIQNSKEFLLFVNE